MLGKAENVFKDWGAAIAPIAWGILSYLIFSILKPVLPVLSEGSTPLWIWLWLLQISLFIPIWIYILSLKYDDKLRNGVHIKGVFIAFGRPTFYLIVAYLAAISAIFTHDRWYGQWFVFGGLISPVFEELFSRYLLTPWLERPWWKFLVMASLSSASFSIMHWAFNDASAFDFTIDFQLQKFLSHFIFGLVLCLIFRFTKCIQIVIWLHIASNLQFVLSKL